MHFRDCLSTANRFCKFNSINFCFKCHARASLSKHIVLANKHLVLTWCTNFSLLLVTANPAGRAMVVIEFAPVSSASKCSVRRAVMTLTVFPSYSVANEADHCSIHNTSAGHVPFGIFEVAGTDCQYIEGSEQFSTMMIF